MNPNHSAIRTRHSAFKILLFFLALGSAGIAATMNEAEKLFRDGNFAEALAQYDQLLGADTKLSPKDAAKAVNRAQTCAGRVDSTKIDAILTKAEKNHGQSWQALLAIAQAYQSVVHRAKLVDGEFRRTWGPYDSTDRDRVRSLQLLVRAFPLVADAKTDEQAWFWRQTAQILMPPRAWRLQTLTDLSTPSDYAERQRHDSRRAPVDADGSPVLHAQPTTWQAAKTDGERWRWALGRLEALGGKHQLQAWYQRANFAHGQFGVQTLGSVWRFSGDDDAEKAELLARKLRDLADTETIAYLATGPSRFDLPDEHNHLRLWQKIANAQVQNGKNELAEPVLEKLAHAFINRDQRPKAAGFLRRAVEISGKDRHKTQLAQLTGKFGRFDGSRVEAPGDPVEVGFVYRNAAQVKFQARRIDFAALLADMKAYLRAKPKEIDRQQTNLNNLGRRLLDAKQQKYLGEETAAWTMKLEPREAHFGPPGGREDALAGGRRVLAGSSRCRRKQDQRHCLDQRHGHRPQAAGRQVSSLHRRCEDWLGNPGRNGRIFRLGTRARQN